MHSITQNKRYCPHEITTKINSVKLYRETKDISFVCRRYHISKASLMRWNKLYDGTKESLIPKSHRPHTPHPKAHTEEELKWICDYHRRNPDISICELYGKLREQIYFSFGYILLGLLNNMLQRQFYGDIYRGFTVCKQQNPIFSDFSLFYRKTVYSFT